MFWMGNCLYIKVLLYGGFTAFESSTFQSCTPSVHSAFEFDVGDDWFFSILILIEQILRLQYNESREQIITYCHLTATGYW